MIYKKNDGEIEIIISSCGCSSRDGGRHTNNCTSWYRVNGDKWQMVLFSQKAYSFAESCNSCEEFLLRVKDWSVNRS